MQKRWNIIVLPSYSYHHLTLRGSVLNSSNTITNSGGTCDMSEILRKTMYLKEPLKPHASEHHRKHHGPWKYSQDLLHYTTPGSWQSLTVFNSQTQAVLVTDFIKSGKMFLFVLSSFMLIRTIAMAHTDLNLMFFETNKYFKFDYHISFNATLHKHFVVQDERALLRVNQGFTQTKSRLKRQNSKANI